MSRLHQIYLIIFAPVLFFFTSLSSSAYDFKMGTVVVNSDTKARYRIVRPLGAGGFKDVYEIKLLDEPNIPNRILKVYHLRPQKDESEKATDSQRVNAAKNSILAYQRVKSWNSQTDIFPKIFEVPVYVRRDGSPKEREYASIIVERYESSLYDLVNVQSKISDARTRLIAHIETAFRILRDLSQQLHYIHRAGLSIGYDMKGGNIMFNTEGHFAFTDFDVMVAVDPASRSRYVDRDFFSLAQLLRRYVFEEKGRGNLDSPVDKEQTPIGRTKPLLFDNEDTAILQDFEPDPDTPLYLTKTFFRTIQPSLSSGLDTKFQKLEEFVEAFYKIAPSLTQKADCVGPLEEVSVGSLK